MSKTEWPNGDLANLSEDERVREVFAYYGLAMYESQVLEHGLANALMMLEFIPRAPEFRDFAEWSEQFDIFLDGELDRTFGALVKRIVLHEVISPELCSRLNEAKEIRNHLAHRFFRENAERFLFVSGQEEMIGYCRIALERFSEADDSVANVVLPIREKYGLTEDWLKSKMDEEMASLLSAEEVRLRGANRS